MECTTRSSSARSALVADGRCSCVDHEALPVDVQDAAPVDLTGTLPPSDHPPTPSPVQLSKYPLSQRAVVPRHRQAEILTQRA